MRALRAILTISFAVALLGACAPKAAGPFAPVGGIDLSPKVASGEYRKGVDNFLFLLDASSSMARPHITGSRYQVAQGLAGTLNQTLPELDWQAGVRFFGPRYEGFTSSSALAYGMTTHNRSDLATALESVAQPSGTTPLAVGLARAGDDLTDLAGRSALVIFSDGNADSASEVLGVVSKLQSRHGDRLCLYPVLVGDSASGAALMELIAEKSACGMVSRADELLSAEAMAAFAVRAFLEPGKPVAAVPVSPVSPVSMEEKEVYRSEAMRLEVNFAFDKANIRPGEHEGLARFADFLTRHPEISGMEISGHTCNMGPKAYNKRLSLRRAESVVNYLVENFNIDRNRFTVKGYGMSQPVASNDTLEGRQHNRRVEAVVTATTKVK